MAQPNHLITATHELHAKKVVICSMFSWQECMPLWIVQRLSSSDKKDTRSNTSAGLLVFAVCSRSLWCLMPSPKNVDPCFFVFFVSATSAIPVAVFPSKPKRCPKSETHISDVPCFLPQVSSRPIEGPLPVQSPGLSRPFATGPRLRCRSRARSDGFAAGQWVRENRNMKQPKNGFGGFWAA